MPAQAVYFDLYSVDPNLGGMLPTDLDGATPPPAGSPNYIVQFDDDAWGYPADQLELFKFHVDWTTPANSTFTGPTIINLTTLGLRVRRQPVRVLTETASHSRVRPRNSTRFLIG